MIITMLLIQAKASTRQCVDGLCFAMWCAALLRCPAGDLDFTGGQMVLTLKLISMAMCFQDANSKKPEVRHIGVSNMLVTCYGEARLNCLRTLAAVNCAAMQRA
jgi:hypothetical protein